MGRELSTKQLLYRKFRLQGLSKVESAMNAGYSRAMAYHHADRVERGVNMPMWFKRHGMDDETLSRKCKEGLEATKVIEIVLEPDPKDPNKVIRKKIEVPDWHARHKHLETILKVAGKMPKNGVTVNTNIAVGVSHGNAGTGQFTEAEERIRLEMREQVLRHYK